MTKLLSLCMIVKNEEKVLKRCLESVQGLVDEIVVVDTGSTDRTVEIAREFTSHVYFFEWINDFAAAKNFSIRHAGSRWILNLDADEFLQDVNIEKVRYELENLPLSESTAFILPIYNFTGTINSGKVLNSSGARLFPNHPDIEFRSPIHEQLYWKHGELRFLEYPLIIYHTGYLEETKLEKNKSTRNMSIFNDLLKKKTLDTYETFTLANEYMIMRDYKKAIYYYEKVYKKAEKRQDWYPHCVERMITAYTELDRYKEAYALIEESVKLWPGYSDLHCFKGLLLDKLGFYKEAVTELSQSIEIAELSNGRQYWILSPNNGTTLPYSKLADIYFEQYKDISKTVYYLTKLVQSNPKDIKHLYKLVHLLTLTEPVSEIVKFLEQLFSHTDPMQIRVLLQIAVTVGHCELSQHYYMVHQKFNIELSPIYMMQYGIIQNDQGWFDKHFNLLSKEDCNNELAARAIYTASCVWKTTDYMDRFTIPKNLLKPTESLLKKVISDTALDESVDFPYDSMSILLSEIFKVGQYDVYDWLINLFPNHFNKLANLMGDYFFKQNQIELSLDYYSMGLTKNELEAQGYENLGVLYIAQGDLQEGLEFIEKAIELHPSKVTLYTTYCLHSNGEKKARYKEQLFNTFPQYKGLPFIKNL
ncbi:glycosyltransferase [Paenibacillus sp. MZ04-78.2]|uniref:TPR domain-containing glycosyltransferase n=1 Tax=Paenibacillus sp. MZ04-78.2 TaxID=2962034 RepID=UPI0020B850A6|nr:TPR domain-containing glycosyltransferase [Paenibacillus sp. MZ04-78.2]MCP3776245.1 glycosyltransferase [Paenibacillus sp. MZ04-78.2]